MQVREGVSSLAMAEMHVRLGCTLVLAGIIWSDDAPHFWRTNSDILMLDC